MKNTGLVVGIAVIVLLAVLLLGGAGMMGLGTFGMTLAPHCVWCSAGVGPGMMGGYRGMMGGGMGGFGQGGMWLGGLLMLAFWVLVIGGVIWLVVTLVRGSQTTPGAPVSGLAPLDILKARYAKGEVTKEQFEEIKRDLGV